ncbi:MAG: ATP-binding protein [Deltaproteobacteria bacterium]|nr:ATP-binding protein [Deltaproteobacteria bacterium]
MMSMVKLWVLWEKLLEKLSITQAELIQAVKIRALGDLVTGVAHEINNPLMASDTFLHLLENETGNGPETKKRIKLLKECNLRIQNIVKKLKEFSRQSKFEFTAMDINDAALSVLEITRQQLLNQGIEVELGLSENLPHVLGDKNQIEQVLLNIISNARDAMEGCSKKVLSIQTDLDKKGKQVEIRLSDTGIGMTTEEIEQIFNPFFTTKDSDKGIGLGLSISYRIIDAHQGKIEVNSELNKGTTFIVTLPVYLAVGKRDDEN